MTLGIDVKIRQLYNKTILVLSNEWRVTKPALEWLILDKGYGLTLLLQQLPWFKMQMATKPDIK